MAKLNYQLKALELKFEREISLLNKIISTLKNEITDLNSKLANCQCGNTCQ